jgi:hypothetical protein
VEAVIPVHIAVEDALSEAVLRMLLAQSGRKFSIGSCYQHGGYGYIKKQIAGFNQAARGAPFFVLTDLDQGYPCPAALIADWLHVPEHPNLVFRVAVREIESWVLADREAFSSLLGVRQDLIPRNTDQLPDAKRFLMDAVRRCRKRELRSAILPASGSTAKQGPDYNAPLVEFVESRWRVRRAANNSPSLKRALDVVRAFTPVWA